MSTLGDIEAAIVTQLSDAEFGGNPLFATVSGASGPVRPGLRQALSRERMPAAYVVFLNEKLTPEVADTEKGPRFAILLAARTLRLTSDPRAGGVEAVGLFDLIEQTRALVDDYAPLVDRKLTPLAQSMLEADDRQAIAQITYIARSA